jgi:hypothetical protein
MFFWMFDVTPVLGAKPKVIWHNDYGDTTLALIDMSGKSPILPHNRWALCAGYRGDLREIIGDYTVWPEAAAACEQWGRYLAGGGTVAAWKEHAAAQRQSEIY